jgi:hypothetical protein
MWPRRFDRREIIKLPAVIFARQYSTGNPRSEIALSGGSGIGSSIFPLSISPNGRFLVTNSGQPFLMVADSFQGGAKESIADITTYLQTRAAQGFNTIQMDLIADSNMRNPDGTNYSTLDGIRPFTGAKVTTPNETYFARMDQIVSLMLENNLVAFLNPYEMSPQINGGGMGDLVAAGATACNIYGRYVANRYKNYPNVMWHFGNDYLASAQNDAVAQALIDGIKSVAPNQLRGGEMCFTIGADSTSTFDNPNFMPPYQNMNGAYTYSATYMECLVGYNAPSVSFAGKAGTNSVPPSPVILVEAHYEYSVNMPKFDDGTPVTLRRTAYWAALSGVTGYIYGNNYFSLGLAATTFRSSNPIFRFLAKLASSGWRTHLNSPGVADLGRWKRFFSSIPWYQLIPDQTHVIATAGYGTPTTNKVPFANDTYVPLSATPDGKYAVAYFSRGSASSLTVNLATFAGQVTAKWFDPTNAVYTTIGTFTNSGAHVFTPSGNNSTGDPDWVLLLTS